MVCRTLNVDADYWKPGLGYVVPRGAQLSVFSLVPAHLAKEFFEFFWNHFESLSKLLKKMKNQFCGKHPFSTQKSRCESDPGYQLFPEQGMPVS